METNTNSPSQSGQLNNLRQARHRAGLERKQVAFLLSKKSTDELSRYERGIYPPNLKTALRLEIIYKMPVRLLFQELFEQLRAEIGDMRAKQSSLLPDNYWFPKSAEQLKQEEFCFYAELLKNHLPNGLELETITKHIIALSQAVSDFKQGRNLLADEPLNKNKDEL
jgi:transcriptional regulator with XRE-family HTH domain